MEPFALIDRSSGRSGRVALRTSARDVAFRDASGNWSRKGVPSAVDTAANFERIEDKSELSALEREASTALESIPSRLSAAK